MQFINALSDRDAHAHTHTHQCPYYRDSKTKHTMYALLFEKKCCEKHLPFTLKYLNENVETVVNAGCLCFFTFVFSMFLLHAYECTSIEVPEPNDCINLNASEMHLVSVHNWLRWCLEICRNKNKNYANSRTTALFAIICVVTCIIGSPSSSMSSAFCKMFFFFSQRA